MDKHSQEIAGYIERLRGALFVGLDWDTAVVAVDVPLSMLDEIEQSDEVKQMRRRIIAEQEYDLLKLHATARKVAASKGQGRPIEWMLGQVRPDKYGKSGGDPSTPTVVDDDF